MTQEFVHLRVHSAFSLSEGAIKIPKLIDACVEKHMPAIAITDTSNMFGCMEFSAKASGAGVQPIIATQINVRNQSSENDIIAKNSGLTPAPDKMVLFAQNRSGYENLMKLLSKAYMETPSHELPQIRISDFAECNNGVIALTGGYHGPIGRQILEGQLLEAEETLLKLKEYFGNRLYMELSRIGLPQEDATEEEFINLAYRHDIPLVATNEAFFLKEEMYEAHDALVCIAAGAYVAQKDRRKLSPNNRLKSPAEMIELFSDIPEAIDNTINIAKRCGYMVEFVPPILPPYDVGEGKNENDVLRERSIDGLKKRLEVHVYKPEMSDAEKEEVTKTYFDRLEYELGIIIQMGFPGYFLIVSDFISWSKANGVPVGPGRGSGAGSVVAWALTITDLDPLRFGLLFERFLNPERVSMPDFDVDFCQENRGKSIEYVQNKYGHDKVAQIITFGKLQAKAVVRDVGRVLQMPYGQVDRISKMIPATPGKQITLTEALDTIPELRAERDNEPVVANMLDIAIKLEGLYRHASTHAAGVVIGDRPLNQICALYKDPNSDMPVTQFDMKWVESCGLIKFDFLGLKTLTVIKRAVDLVKKVHNVDIDISAITLEDRKTYELLQRAETAGVFQLESSGMRDILRQLRPDKLEDIIAIVSLYRPGPMDNIPSYIKRKHGDEEPDYLHPKLEPILKETYGIMIYQEQVMQIAQVLAGYTLGGADLLRRAMGKKKVEEMVKQRQIFNEGAKERGVEEARSDSIFSQMEKFAGYGFNKSHAAAYALIAYQTAYLKAHYPVEFLSATMSLDINNTDKLGFFKEEARKMGISVLTPDINNSEVDFAVENSAIRYALSAIKGVGANNMEALVAERNKGGSFKDINDFIRRLNPKSINRRQLENLIKAGAFDSIDKNRAKLYNSVSLMLQHANTINEEKNSSQGGLFGEEVFHARIELPNSPDWTQMERLKLEAEAIGFYLSAHPLDDYKDGMEKLRVTTIAELDKNMREGETSKVKMAGIVNSFQTRISKSGNKYAFVEFSDTTGSFDALFFSDSLARYKDLLSSGTPLLLALDAERKTAEEPPRFLARRVETLDDAIGDIANGLIISFNNEVALPAIKEALASDGAGRNKIFIKPDIEDWDIEICLETGYAISDGLIGKLRSISGITAIKEL